MTTPEQSQLGKPVRYADQYDLPAVPDGARAQAAGDRHRRCATPFFGADL